MTDNDAGISALLKRIRDFRRCAIYTRQSRGSSAVLSSSEAQRQICCDFGAARSWVILSEIYDDVRESSETLERPGLQRLLADLALGVFDTVLIYRLDRLTRRILDFARLMETFQQHKVQLLVVTNPQLSEGASASLLANMAITFAEFEQSMTRERMSESRAYLKSQGRRVAGQIPYGYTTDSTTKQLIPHDVEADRVRTMFRLAGEGQTPREISDFANKQGWEIQLRVRSQVTSASWTPRQVLRVLTNPTHAGLIRAGNSTKSGSHEALVSRDLFDRVAQIVASRRSRTPGRTPSTVAWPLRGLIRCGRCRRLLTPSVSGYKKFRYRYYRCRSDAGGIARCRGVSLPAHEVEQFVCRQLATLGSENGVQAKEERQTAIQVSAAWSALNDQEQLRLLPLILAEVVIEPDAETIELTLAANAMAILRGNACNSRDRH